MNGLSNQEVLEKRRQHGSNAMELQEERVLLNVLKEIVMEPMFILLLIACVIYFITGSYQEGIIMLISIFLVAGISIFQEYRSRNAVQALKKLSQSHVKVIRNGIEEEILIEDLVVDDIMLIEEGEIISADAVILTARDFSINESILTGESFAVYKSADADIYRGTLVTSGNATAKVNAVGTKTMFGKIGLAVKEVIVVKTPLQKQIKAFVRNMVWIGAVAFAIVITVNYIQTKDILHSLMHGLTLAMSILPEEIPVAFSTFLALGAFRLLKNKIIVKQPQYVETLGAATVICADKTGTLTENKMSIAHLFDAASDTSFNVYDIKLPEELVEFAMWSSETEPFDPMEQAIHKLYASITATDKRVEYEQVHEYPIGGIPPIMTHIFQGKNGSYIIAAKGAPERILKQSDLSIDRKKQLEEQALSYARQGFRVLGVGKGIWEGSEWPAVQDEFKFEFLGLVAFQDPPKKNIDLTIKTFNEAGISVKMITGDYAETAVAIAKQIGLNHNGDVITGAEVLKMEPLELQTRAKAVNVYARMFPEAKLKVIDALKEAGEVVAMTGDGVNDAPALKAAHIGIAMGQRGSEVAKGAASLILMDDDLAHMTDAVALGRKIYDNLKKAIQYIVSIHIPIILIVMLPLVLGWAFAEIFTPVHVIFLELIMGPTCSIIYENEPMEPGTMNRPPRIMSSTFLSFRQLLTSIIQGLFITTGCLGIGYWAMKDGQTDTLIRTLVFITLLFSNIFLTLVNRSFYYSFFTTLRYKNNLVLLIIGVTLLFIVGILTIPGLQNLFRLEPLSWHLLAISVSVAFVSTCWIEIAKAVKRMRQ
ncbi:MAG TPA: cation-translocating P-type ATPase [Chitinophagaceae bacterium]|nr:cation-translocating P-type ATPase [Chitinophagaceae bacterium]